MKAPSPVTPVMLATALTEFRLPPPLKAPEKRKRTFEARLVPWATVSAVMELVTEVNPSAPAALANLEVFTRFVTLNDPEGTIPRDFLLLLYSVDIQLQGIAATTTKTYVKGIMWALERAGKPIKGPSVTDMFKILAYLTAHEDADHALDISEETGMRVVAALSGDAQVTAWAMKLCGARIADLERMERHQFLFAADGSVRISFQFTKNRRSKAAAYSLLLQLPMDEPIPASVVAAMKAAPQTRIFPLDVDGFNKAIRQLGSEFEGITSYSFRRLFVHRVIDRFTEDGMTAWEECVKLTAHKKIETLRNSYAKKFQNVL